MTRTTTDPDRVLVVVAHPDDMDFGAAGTVARWTADGVEVAYLVVTDGQAGGFDPAVPRDEMARTRRDEQRAAASKVGVDEVIFLGLQDGEVQATLELRRTIAGHIRRVRPNIVVTSSPERDWSRLAGPGHPDHLATGEATVCAVYPDARNPFAFPDLLEEEGLEPHTVAELWLMGGPTPDHAVDITGTVEPKLAALRCHASQIRDPADLEERLRGLLRRNAQEAGLGADRYAERFQVVRTA